jgi:hypothetical protein
MAAGLSLAGDAFCVELTLAPNFHCTYVTGLTHRKFPARYSFIGTGQAHAFFLNRAATATQAIYPAFRPAPPKKRGANDRKK